MPTKLELELEQIDEQLIALQQKRQKVQQQILDDMNATPQKQVELIVNKLKSEVQPLYRKACFDFDVTTYGSTDNGINILITDHYTRCTFKYIKYKRTPLSKSHDIPTLFTNLLPTLQEFIKCLRALYASQLKLHINSKQFNLIPYEDKIIIMFSHQYSRVTDNHIDLRFAIDEDTGLITKLTLINTLSENCDDYHIIDIPQTPYEVHVDLENYCWSGVSIQQQLEFNEDYPFDYKNVVPKIQAFCDYIQSEQ